MKQQFVATHTTRPTEIPASPDSSVTNTPFVKMLCPQQHNILKCRCTDGRRFGQTAVAWSIFDTNLQESITLTPSAEGYPTTLPFIRYVFEPDNSTQQKKDSFQLLSVPTGEAKPRYIIFSKKKQLLL